MSQWFHPHPLTPSPLTPSPSPTLGEGLGVRVKRLAAHSLCENESALPLKRGVGGVRGLVRGVPDFMASDFSLTTMK